MSTPPGSRRETAAGSFARCPHFVPERCAACLRASVQTNGNEGSPDSRLFPSASSWCWSRSRRAMHGVHTARVSTRLDAQARSSPVLSTDRRMMRPGRRRPCRLFASLVGKVWVFRFCPNWRRARPSFLDAAA